MARRLNDAVGWLQLRLAVVLHRTVAGRAVRDRWQQRRNAALRAAHRRGVPVELLAARLGLTEGWVRQVVKNPKAAEDSA